MSVADVLLQARHAVEAADVTESAALDVELVVGDVLGLDRVGLRLRGDRELTTPEADEIAARVARLCRAEPVQYILERAWFRNLELFVDRRVLVPRPETEQLVDIALVEIARLREAGRTRPIRVVDVCTGSGCVAIAIEREATAAWGDGAVEMFATELSHDAADVARLNAERCGAQVSVVEGSLLEPVDAPPAGETFDVVVANPPYVARSEQQSLTSRVVDYEPHVALFAPGDDDAVDLARGIADQARAVLADDGVLAIEHGMGQRALLSAACEVFGYGHVAGHDDLAGIDRIVSARWKGIA